MITGHQHSCFSYLQDRLVTPEAEAKAKAAGAKGFRLVGCTCVGQDLQLRGAHYTEVFVGHAGNNFTSEAVLSTGAIDAVLSEFNCTLPGIEPICDALDIKQICLDDVAKKSNAEYMPFVFETREADADRIIDKVLESYKSRRGKVELRLMPEHGNKDTLTGVSETSLKKFLGGNWKPLIDLIAAGKIKGVAGVVGCSNLTFGGHDVLTVELTKSSSSATSSSSPRAAPPAGLRTAASWSRRRRSSRGRSSAPYARSSAFRPSSISARASR